MESSLAKLVSCLLFGTTTLLQFTSIAASFGPEYVWDGYRHRKCYTGACKAQARGSHHLNAHHNVNAMGMGIPYGYGSNFGYGNSRFGYGSNQFGYGSNQLGYGSNRLGYGNNQLGYGNNLGYGNTMDLSTYGSLIAANPSLYGGYPNRVNPNAFPSTTYGRFGPTFYDRLLASNPYYRTGMYSGQACPSSPSSTSPLSMANYYGEMSNGYHMDPNNQRGNSPYNYNIHSSSNHYLNGASGYNANHIDPYRSYGPYQGYEASYNDYYSPYGYSQFQPRPSGGYSHKIGLMDALFGPSRRPLNAFARAKTNHFSQKHSKAYPRNYQSSTIRGYGYSNYEPYPSSAPHLSDGYHHSTYRSMSPYPNDPRRYGQKNYPASNRYHRDPSGVVESVGHTIKRISSVIGQGVRRFGDEITNNGVRTWSD